VEGLRIDSLMMGELRVAQMMSLVLMAAAAVGLLLWRGRRG
jgi:hypothetical protein